MFSQLIDRFFSSSEASSTGRKSCLYVFQGFSAAFLNELSHSGISYITGAWDSEYPEVPVSESRLSALKEGLASFKKEAWCLYEDFIALSLTEGAFSGRRFAITVVRNDIYGEDGINVYYPLPVSEATAKRLDTALTGKTETPDPVLSYYCGMTVISGRVFIRYVNTHFKLHIGKSCAETGFYAALDDGTELTAPEAAREIPLSSLDEFALNLENGNAPGVCVSGSSALRSGFVKRVRALNILAGEMGGSIACGTETALTEPDDSLSDLLKTYWGKDAEFRYSRFYTDPANSRETCEISQGHIINDIIAQCRTAAIGGNASYSDLLVTAPTGSGKSVFFQIPGVYLHRNMQALTIVVCPLIALMVDQVQELHERGIDFATFINGSITFEERSERIAGIKSGKYSIVYLSPELLLAGDISDIIGERKIGLMTVDEAHLVTSWGRDFRVDYWFLGDFVEKLRKGTATSPARRFPVLCLTATAVYGGSDDIVHDLIRSMHLNIYKNEMYIGYVRRDDIMFMMRHPKKDGQPDRKVKNSCAATQIASAVRKRKKTIVYFPFKSQVDEIKKTLLDEQPEAWAFVESYTGDMPSLDKDKSYTRFRDGSAPAMLATKAFGMGVNIDDIGVVYHYAPTGSLSDYVQEIGRAARNHSKVPIGLAITDYMRSDMRYASTLWGLSGLRHYQLKAMAARLVRMTEEKNSRSLTIEPETFAYMFDDTGLDNKVKSGLMLLSGDLTAQYGFSVLEVNAQSLFSTQYIVVPDSLKRRFLPVFSDCVTLMNDSFTQHELAYGKTAAVDTRKTGDIYEIDMNTLWETHFSKLSFAQFKKDFFSGDLFAALPGLGDSFDRVVPQMKLIIDFSRSGYEQVTARFTALANALQQVFSGLKSKYGGKNFSANEFTREFKNKFACSERNEYISLLLDLFSYPHVDIGAAPKDHWKFVEKRRDSAGPGMAYCLRTQKPAYIGANLMRFFQQMQPNTEDGQKYVAYISMPRSGDKIVYQQLVASILQLFDMASCEYIGGRNPHVEVRVNDPGKLKLLSEPATAYRNTLLTDIETRHNRAKVIMNRFLGGDFKDSERWEIIENYFLGLDNKVDELLGLNGEKEPETGFEGFSFEGCDINLTPWSEGEEVLPYCQQLMLNEAIQPELTGGTLRIGEIDYPLNYVWLERKVVFPETVLSAEAVELVTSQGFRIFDISEPDYSLIK